MKQHSRLNETILKIVMSEVVKQFHVMKPNSAANPIWLLPAIVAYPPKLTHVTSKQSSSHQIELRPNSNIMPRLPSVFSLQK